MKHPPLISIIIPVYKVEEYLDYCVKSIINQEFKDFEIILIDDGSPDNCPAICDEWAHKDNRIRVIHKENGGLSDARNYGIDTAKGEYVWFVDSDDWIAEDSLKSIVYGCEKYPQADAIAVQIIEIRDGNKVFNGSIKEWPMEDTLISNSNFVERFTSILPSVRYIVKNDVYKKNNLRFITGILHEDIPFCHMLMHYIKYIALIPKVAYLYRIRGGSITTTPNINSCYSLVKSSYLCHLWILLYQSMKGIGSYAFRMISFMRCFFE